MCVCVRAMTQLLFNWYMPCNHGARHGVFSDGEASLIAAASRTNTRWPTHPAGAQHRRCTARQAPATAGHADAALLLPR